MRSCLDGIDSHTTPINYQAAKMLFKSAWWNHSHEETKVEEFYNPPPSLRVKKLYIGWDGKIKNIGYIEDIRGFEFLTENGEKAIVTGYSRKNRWWVLINGKFLRMRRKAIK